MADSSWSLPAEEFDVVAVASSAGGLAALRALLAGLSETLATVLVAHHRGEGSANVFIRLLQACTALNVTQADEGEVPRAGRVYVSPGGRHLELDAAGRLSVRRQGRVNFVCPSADLLFRSVAAHYGPRALAVVLTGLGRDAAEGVTAIRRAGGFVIVQDPRECAFPGMPASAIETRKVDLVLPLANIAYALGMLTSPRRARLRV